MYRFYVERDAVSRDGITLAGEDYNHIRNVLRMREGEEIIVCDGAGMDYVCRIREMAKDHVVAQVVSQSASETELGVRLVLFQGMPKKDKLEFIIQKSVELGVAQVVPVMTKRTVIKLEDAKKEEKKRARWQSIARAAAMQSMRGVIPQVAPVVSFAEALAAAGELDAILVPYENERGIGKTRGILEGLVRHGVRSVGIFIGPEGGFDEAEVRQAMDAGASCITLGRRILRTETAGLAALSLLMFLFEGLAGGD